MKKNGEGMKMRGFYTNGGYWGNVEGRYMLFASESDYFEYMADAEA